MAVKASYTITLTRVDDGQQGVSVEKITNFYKVSTKSTGETAQSSGGRNLVEGTSEDIIELGGYPSASGSNEGKTFTTINVPKEDEYIVSFYAKSTVAGDRIRCYWYNPNTTTSAETSTGYKGNISDGKSIITLTTELKKYWVKWTQTSTTTVKCLIVGRRSYSEGTGTISIRSIKLESGVKPTDWTPAPEDSGWSTTVPTLTATNKYLWNYEMIEMSDGTCQYTDPRIIGVYGDKGNTGGTGNGISSITEYYQVSTSNSTAPTSWLTTVPTLTATNKYLWNYEHIVYTNNTTKDTLKRVIGVYGDKGNTGAAGKGIKSTAITYQASTSGTTAPTGTWGASIPTVAQGQYLWSRTVITYTDNTTSTTYSVAYLPKNGSTGATGTGVASITQQYYLSTNKTSQSGGSWVETMPTWSSGKYLWTRYKVTYKNPTSTAYTSPICDSSWEAVNEAQVGGRNYVLNRYGTPKYTSNGITIECLDNAFHIFGTNTKTDVAWGHATNWIFREGILEVGEYYTLSVNTKLPKDIYVQLNSSSKDGSKAFMITRIVEGQTLSTAKVPEDCNGLSYGFFGFHPTLKDIDITIKIKLEKGNKATDWTPAPEDVEDKIADVDTEIREEITKQSTDIIKTSEGIILEALKSYTSTGDFDSFKQEMSSALEVLSNSVNITLTKQIETLVNENGELQKQINKYEKYFAFADDGLTIGQSDSPYKVILDHDDLVFMKDGNTEVIRLDVYGNGVIPKLQVGETLTLFGIYELDKDESTEIVNCSYIGG